MLPLIVDIIDNVTINSSTMFLINIIEEDDY